VAGLGNIYVCEALNRARLSPKVVRHYCDQGRRPNVRAQSAYARHQGGAAGRHQGGAHRCAITGAPMASLGFQHSFRVYDREGKPCPTRGCTGKVRRIVQTGRSTFYCPTCQK